VIVHKDELHTFKTNKKISKINEKTKQKFYKNVVNFIEAPNNDRVQCVLKASYSVKLCDALIDIYFKKDSLIYDPFTGIGTTQLSCVQNNCAYIGSELSTEIFNIAKERISERIAQKIAENKQIICNEHVKSIQKAYKEYVKKHAKKHVQSEQADIKKVF
jgi:DNA modification methylase